MDGSGHMLDHHGDMTASFSSSNGQYGYGGEKSTAPPPEIPPRSPARTVGPPGYPLGNASNAPNPIPPPDNATIPGEFNFWYVEY